MYKYPQTSLTISEPNLLTGITSHRLYYTIMHNLSAILLTVIPFTIYLILVNLTSIVKF